MIFIGSDKSVVEVSDNQDYVHLYFTTSQHEGGISFKDIAEDSYITLKESLWVRGLRSSRIEALDMYLVYTCHDYNQQNYNEYLKLRKNRQRRDELKRWLDYIGVLLMKGCEYPLDFVNHTMTTIAKLDTLISKQEMLIRDNVVLS